MAGAYSGVWQSTRKSVVERLGGDVLRARFRALFVHGDGRAVSRREAGGHAAIGFALAPAGRTGCRTGASRSAGTVGRAFSFRQAASRKKAPLREQGAGNRAASG